MDPCLLKKLLFAAGGGVAAGAGGYYAKGMTWAAVGAGVGGIVGWLLAPGCEAGSPSAVSPIRMQSSNAFQSLIPIKSGYSFDTKSLRPQCTATQYYDASTNKCWEAVK